MPPALKLAYTEGGIATARETWLDEITKPHRREQEKKQEIEEYIRELREVSERREAEIAAVREHARRIAEYTLLLQRQAEEHAREAARVNAAHAELERVFRDLADEWLTDTMFDSSPTDKFLHHAYLMIIGMGTAVVPLLLREVQNMTGDWFLALRSVTREDPAEAAEEGRMRASADAWVRWGQKRGLI
jgi:cyanate lyase